MFKDLDEAGGKGFLEAADADVDGGEEEVEGDGGGEAHGGADEGDADFVGDLVGLNFVAAADAAECGHHAEHRAEEAEERAAFDGGGDPAGAVFEFAEDVLRDELGESLAEGVVADVAVEDGDVGELREGPWIGAALLAGHRVLAGVELGDQLFEKRGLLLAVFETELPDAAEGHDDAEEAPEKIEGEEDVTGIAESLGQVVNAKSHGAVFT